jgi:thiamine pyrophosphokinase
MNITLYSPQQAHKVLNDVWAKCKADLMAGQKFSLTITKQKRSNDQNKLFHALIGEIAKQTEHAGARWDIDSWKRFLVDQWAKETNRSSGKVAPSLDGQRVVQLGLQTRDFTKDDASEFTEWLYAWCADRGIETTMQN